MAGPAPHRIRVRMYQVGFGDCFLLSFEYKKALPDNRKVRHVLVDFGSTHGPRGGKADMVGVAKAIAEHTDGTLDVVVATHRHKDHISAFGNADVGAVLSELKPRLVVRPWTENPKAADNARSPLSLDDHRFALGLGQGQAFSEKLALALGNPSGKSLRGSLKQMALLQVANQKAIDQLDLWAADAKASYVHAGRESGIEKLVPGLSVTVLGPPTIEQYEPVKTQRSSDKEYWMLYGKLLRKGLAPTVAAAAATTLEGDDEAEEDESDEVALSAAVEAMTSPGPVRWMVERLRHQELHSLQRLVRSLDAALNNTSIILLFEVGDRTLLFPGDAQIENWNYTLLKNFTPDIRKRLSRVDLYKVGHHGSRNATPMSIYKLWTDPAVVDRPMTALMSTRAGVHGESEATAVPRSRLVTALKKRMTVLSTEKHLGKDDLWIEVESAAKGGEGFVRV